MYEYCSICGDPSSYFKFVEGEIVCHDCLYMAVWEELTPAMREKFRDTLWAPVPVKENIS